MDNKLLLAKCITLLFRESQLSNNNENSSDLIRTVLSNIQISDINIGLSTDRDMLIGLKSTIQEMCDNPLDHKYILEDVLQTLKIISDKDYKYFETIKQSLETEMSEASIKRSIINLRRAIHNHFREQKISDILTKASSSFKFQRNKIKDVNDFLAGLFGELEPLQATANLKDPAVIGEVDISNDTELNKVFDDAKKSNSGARIWKTGFKDLNDMCQGGFRTGELVVIGALQHKYKTGFSLSLFAQLATINNAADYIKDTTKKPLIVRISTEDSLDKNLQFLYQYLKYNETREKISINNVSSEEMAHYVKAKLQSTGFNVKMLRIDATQWTYRSLCNKIIEYEAEGYEVEACVIDYLGMIPTIGCINTGATGTDLIDMVRRVKNFFAARDTLCITPHQLSTEAKVLIRGGLPEHTLPMEVAEKGYWKDCRSLDTEIDLELVMHIFKHNGSTYLAVQRGKHRLPTIVNDEYKYFILPFPKNGMPILSDLDRQTPAIRKPPSVATNTTDDLFELG